MSQQTPTRCTLYLHQKSPPPGRFYNQFANLKRNFLIDFSIQKLSVRNEDFHLNPLLGIVKLFWKSSWLDALSNSSNEIDVCSDVHPICSHFDQENVRIFKHVQKMGQELGKLVRNWLGNWSEIGQTIGQKIDQKLVGKVVRN